MTADVGNFGDWCNNQGTNLHRLYQKVLHVFRHMKQFVTNNWLQNNFLRMFNSAYWSELNFINRHFRSFSWSTLKSFRVTKHSSYNWPRMKFCLSQTCLSGPIQFRLLGSQFSGPNPPWYSFFDLRPFQAVQHFSFIIPFLTIVQVTP